MKTEIDPSGGTSYSLNSTTQFFSVPYAKQTDLAKIAEGITYYSNAIHSSFVPWPFFGSTIRNSFVPNPTTLITISKASKYLFQIHTDFGATNKCELKISSIYSPDTSIKTSVILVQTQWTSFEYDSRTTQYTSVDIGGTTYYNHCTTQDKSTKSFIFDVPSSGLQFQLSHKVEPGSLTTGWSIYGGITAIRLGD